jgi:NAD(P) transhydrogenase subunit alpha
VIVLGYRNWAARIPVAATQLYARNLLTFLSTFWNKAEDRLVLPPDDPIVQGAMLTQNGAVVHPRFLATA